MRNSVIILVALLVAFSCSETSIPSKIILSCKCIESESSNNKCLYGDPDTEVEVDFETNSMTFGGKNYKNIGTTPTSFSVRDNSDFVVLNRGNLKLTFDYQRSREIYQCNESEI